MPPDSRSWSAGPHNLGSWTLQSMRSTRERSTTGSLGFIVYRLRYSGDPE